MSASPLRRQGAVIAAAVLVPLAIALVWVPVRTRAPNVDLALVLVVGVACIGALAPRSAIVAAALAAALSFDFFATAPYERLDISRLVDLETTLVLAAVALVVGELARRLRRHRRSAMAGSAGLSTLHDAAELVASGEELVRVIEAVVADLTRMLSLSRCWFECEAPHDRRATVTRGGELDLGRTSSSGPGAASGEAELPVVVEGRAIGHFVLGLTPGRRPERASLLLAVTLADTVAIAFLAQAPPPPPAGNDERPAIRLRLLGSAPPPPAAPAARDQDTSGLSRAAGSSRV